MICLVTYQAFEGGFWEGPFKGPSKYPDLPEENKVLVSFSADRQRVSSTGFDSYRVGSLLSSHAYMCWNPMKAFFFILWFGTAVINSYGRKACFWERATKGGMYYVSVNWLNLMHLALLSLAWYWLNLTSNLVLGLSLSLFYSLYWVVLVHWRDSFFKRVYVGVMQGWRNRTNLKSILSKSLGWSRTKN
jgi:hypothetical protein